MFKNNVDKIISYAVIGFLTIIPFFEQITITAGGKTIAICLIAASSLLIASLFKKNISLSVSRADVAMALLAVFVLLRNVAGIGITTSNRYFFLFLLILYLFGRIYSHRLIKPLIYGIILSGSVQAVIAWLQFFEIIESNHSSFLATGSFHNPAPLGGWMDLSSMSIVYLAIKQIRAQQYLRTIRLMPCLFLIITVLIITDSRAARLSLGSGVLWLALDRAFKKRLWKWMCIVIVILAAIYPLYQLKPKSADGRVMIWKTCYNLAKENPVTGQGCDAVKRNYMDFQAEYLRSQASYNEQMLASDNIFAFNEAINVLCSYGIIGLCLLVTALVMFFLEIGKRRFMGYMMLCYNVFAMFSYPFSIISLMTVFVLLLATTKGTLLKVRLNKASRTVGIAATCIILIMFAHSRHSYLKMLDAMKDYFWDVEKVAYLKENYQHYANESTLVTEYARTLFESGKYEEAIPVFKQLAKLRPVSDVYIDLGQCYQHCGLPLLAIRCYEHAANMLPAYATPQYRLFKLYQSVGDKERTDEAAFKLYFLPKKKYSRAVEKMRGEALEHIINNTDYFADMHDHSVWRSKLKNYR